jgi:hypothetical protein
MKYLLYDHLLLKINEIDVEIGLQKVVFCPFQFSYVFMVFVDLVSYHLGFFSNKMLIFLSSTFI